VNSGAPPLRWYFDPISPFAALQWPRIKALAEEREVTLVPVLLAAILSARGQKGPAEIPGKREFTYRHALWQARQAGVPLTFPPAHPFNPIAALRLCIAGGCTLATVDATFDWVWTQGRAGDSNAALAPLLQQLGIAPHLPDSDVVKVALRAHTDAALAAGVFGVPTLQVGEALFWGNDAHAFALAAIADPMLLQDAEMQRLGTLPIAAVRAGLSAPMTSP
jgi:2-hydroxychromene-2-carboxylate isomerase